MTSSPARLVSPWLQSSGSASARRRAPGARLSADRGLHRLLRRRGAARLSLLSEDGISAPLEVNVKVMVPKGAKVEGKTFRLLATKDRSKQPKASQTGTELEVQAWSFKNRPAQADSDHTGHLASLRLEFGPRKGETIPGNILLCVAKGQTTMFDKTPTKEESYAAGSFVARIEK